jgi:sialate O-acetylesterase
VKATAPNGTEVVFNASAVLANNGSAIELSAPVPSGWKVRASSYGRASWPMTIFFSVSGVPVLPWFSELNETKPWVIPPFATVNGEDKGESRPHTTDLGATPWTN